MEPSQIVVTGLGILAIALVIWYFFLGDRESGRKPGSG